MHDSYLLLLVGALVGFISTIAVTWVSQRFSTSTKNRELKDQAHKILAKFSTSYSLNPDLATNERMDENFKVISEGIDLNSNNPKHLNMMIGILEQAIAEKDTLLARLRELEKERGELEKELEG